MIGLPPGVLCPKKIVQGQMIIDFVDVEIVWHTKLFGWFNINKINKRLIFSGHKTLGGWTIILGQSNCVIIYNKLNSW